MFDQRHSNVEREHRPLPISLRFLLFKFLGFNCLDTNSNYLFAQFRIYKQLEEHIINTVTKNIMMVVVIDSC